MSRVLRWRSERPEQTLALGRALGRLLRPGVAIALSGPLGSGKTYLVKGIAAGLDVPPDEPVVSPTFVLVREYVGRLKLYHIDAYRLRSGPELLALGLEEMLADPQGALAIEWADRVAEAVPLSAWRIELAHAGPEARALTIRVPDTAVRTALARELRSPGDSRG